MALSAKDQRERDGWHFTALRNNTDGNTGISWSPMTMSAKENALEPGLAPSVWNTKAVPIRGLPARVDLLNAIGMVWDVRQFQWNRMYQALERYLQKHGTARVPQSYVTEGGVKLGIWLNKVRMEYKRGRLVPGATGPVRGPGRGLGARSSAQGELGAFFCAAGGLCCL